MRFFKRVCGFGGFVTLALRAGGAVLGSVTLPPQSLVGETDPTRTVIFTAAAGDPHLGQPLEIAITLTPPLVGVFAAGNILFDNVRLASFTGDLFHGSFGNIDAAPNDATRLNIVCTQIPCGGTLEFHDRRGVLVSQQQVNLPPGGQTSLELPAPSRSRGCPPNCPPGTVPGWFLTAGNAVTSLEVFDSDNLRTRLFTTWGDGSVPQTGRLAFGPAGITRGQTARLHGFCNSSARPAACQSTFVFQDANGRVLKQAAMKLEPGTGGSLDLAFDALNLPDRRLEILPSVTITGGMGVASLALLDADGATITQSYPAALVSVGRLP